MNLPCKNINDSVKKSTGKQSIEDSFFLHPVILPPCLAGELAFEQVCPHCHTVCTYAKLIWKGKGFKCTGEGKLPDCSRMLCCSVGGRWYQEEVGSRTSQKDYYWLKVENPLFPRLWWYFREPGRSFFTARDRSFTFQLRFHTDIITSTDVINTDVLSVGWECKNVMRRQKRQ